MKSWPENLSVELHGFGAEPPPDESAQTQSVLAWQQLQRVFAGSLVRLRYVDITTDLDNSYWLRIWDFPTFRVLYGGREIGRTNALFSSAETLARWLERVAGHLKTSRRSTAIPHFH